MVRITRRRFVGLHLFLAGALSAPAGRRTLHFLADPEAARKRFRAAAAALRPKRNPAVAWRRTEHGLLLERGTSGPALRTNRTGAWIWERCTGEWTVAALAAGLSAAFGADQETCLADLLEHLHRLRGLGLVSMESAA